MQYINLGRTGLKVSKLCLGCMTYGNPNWRPWVLQEAQARPFLKQALESGINFFDSADIYSLGASEEILGRAIKDMAKRDEVVIATKVFNPMGPGPNAKGLSRKHILEGIDASLQRLGMDYVDLYIIHRYDYDTPLEETLEALSDVVRAGKARYLGASSMWAWQFMKALGLQARHGWARFVAMQNHYNLIYREEEREMIPLCISEGIAVTPWSPLARGFLAGNRKRGEDARKGGDTVRAQTDDIAQNYYDGDADFAIAERLQALAKRHGKPPAQIALAWLLAKPGVTAPVIGASKPGQLEDALGALDVKLAGDDVQPLEELYQPRARRSSLRRGA
ncbi:MAG: aldo/keto reductase [Gammaproteobacteria bacterium]